MTLPLVWRSCICVYIFKRLLERESKLCKLDISISAIEIKARNWEWEEQNVASSDFQTPKKWGCHEHISSSHKKYFIDGQSNQHYKCHYTIALDPNCTGRSTFFAPPPPSSTFLTILWPLLGMLKASFRTFILRVLITFSYLI